MARKWNPRTALTFLTRIRTDIEKAEAQVVKLRERRDSAAGEIREQGALREYEIARGMGISKQRAHQILAYGGARSGSSPVPVQSGASPES